MRASRIGQGLLEELKLMAAVVGDEIENDAQAAAMGRLHQLGQVGLGAEARVDFHVVDRVVAVIAADLEDRRQPNGSDPQAGDVVQMVDDAAQSTADERLHLSRLQPAIGRGGKAIHHDLVDDGFVGPGRGLEAVDDIAVEGGWLGRAVDAKLVGPTPSPSPSPSEEEGSQN